MRLRSFAAFLVFAVAIVACGGDDGAEGSTGSTGASGSDQLATFSAVAQNVETGITVSISGVSCNGLEGPYDVTIAAQGNATGQTSATLELTNGKGTLEWSMDVTGAAEGTLSGKYLMELSETAGVFVVTGTSTVDAGGSVQSFPVKIRDVPIGVGTGSCPS